MFRERLALRQPKVHIGDVPRSVEVHVNEPTLGYFPSGVDYLVIPVLRDIGKAEVKRGSFGTFEKGRPTFSLAVPIAPQILGIDDNLVSVVAYKLKTKKSGFCGAVRARSPGGLQKSK